MQELKVFDVGLGRYSEDGSPCIVAFDADQNPRVLNGQIYLKDDVDAVLAEKDATIAELKNEINRKDGVGQRWFERCMEARTENVRLKRALWLARATIAHSTKYKYHRLSFKAEIYPQPHGWSCYINGEVYRTGKMNRKLEPHYWIELWEEVERKCRAKAEEYE